MTFEFSALSVSHGVYTFSFGAHNDASAAFSASRGRREAFGRKCGWLSPPLRGALRRHGRRKWKRMKGILPAFYRLRLARIRVFCLPTAGPVKVRSRVRLAPRRCVGMMMLPGRGSSEDAPIGHEPRSRRTAISGIRLTRFRARWRIRTPRSVIYA